ncbi:hypothetical protein VST7929_00434 [Vibrio stylophorae]|uniref:YggT family protein n=1 Tax=Vibrio stylophorae TaxID=659351 RepID=A0ABM8ZQL7_9VIBR|nr:YggT family protein [Vibrio stylophorae]CAH0532595.1 hypothetical protein VST7929_00434 [Vibrio stylophorae]
MQAVIQLVSTLFNLVIFVVLLRLWLQYVRADFYNPFSQFVVKATQPVVGPLRRAIPPVGNIDSATLVFAYALVCAKLGFLLPQGGYQFSADFPLLALVSLIKAAGEMVFWMLLIRAILSWVSQGRSPIEYVLHQLVEPICAPVRRIIPAMGGLDFSILIIFLLMQFANSLIGQSLLTGWYYEVWYL